MSTYWLLGEQPSRIRKGKPCHFNDDPDEAVDFSGSEKIINKRSGSCGSNTSRHYRSAPHSGKHICCRCNKFL